MRVLAGSPAHGPFYYDYDGSAAITGIPQEGNDRGYSF